MYKTKPHRQQNHEQSLISSTSSQQTSSSSQNRNSTNQHYSNGISSLSATTSANPLEPCKHSISSTKNDQSPTKATTVTN